MLVLMLSAVCLWACKDSNKKATLESVTTNIKEFYYIDETIEWDKISVVTKYSDKTSKVLEKGEFDIKVADAKPDTLWVLDTDGLKAETAGSLTAKEYNLTLHIVGEETTYPIKVTVSENESVAYDLDLFGVPACISSFRHNVSADNPNGFKNIANAKYYVGDDNGFDITPEYTLYRKNTDIDSDVKIQLSVKVLLDNVEVNEEYYTYADGKIDFTEKAVGKEFTIKVLPKYFTQNRDGDDIVEASFNVNVKDGYNIYDEKDLGMLSITPDGINMENYNRNISCSIFYNKDATGSKYYAKSWVETWKNFLKANGYKDDEIKYIKGAYFHKDLNVTKDDLPSEFFITAEESADGYATGKLRDWVLAYTHYMEDDFTLEGNFFTVNLENLPVNGSIGENGTRIYKKGEKPTDFGHSKMFNFIGMCVYENEPDKLSNEKIAYVSNINAIGNTNGIISGSGESASEEEKQEVYSAAGGMIIFQNASCGAVAENINIKSAMIGWFIEMTDKENNNINNNSKEQLTTLNNMNITDCFNSAIFSWGGQGGCDITNSKLARLGGPSIFAVSVHNGSKNDGTESRGCYVNYDNTVEFENYIGGGEAWFNITPGAEAAAMNLKKLDPLFNAYGKSILKEDKFNLKVLFMDSSYLNSSGVYLYGKVNNYEFTNQYVLAFNKQGAPFIWTNGESNNQAYIGQANNNYAIFNLDQSQRQTPLTGNELNLVYPANGAGMGIIMDLYDVTKA